MSFGFSPSDIVALVQLTSKAYHGWKNACGEYSEITGSLDSLLIILERIKSEASKPGSMLLHTASDKQDLKDILFNCQPTIRELHAIVIRYKSLGLSREKNWDKLRLGVKNLDPLRVKLTQHIAAIAAYLDAVGLSALGYIHRDLNAIPERIQRTIDALAAEIRAGRREGSIMTTYSDDDKDVWKQLRRELIIGDGLKSSFVYKYKPLIRKYLKELAEKGELEELPPDDGSGAEIMLLDPAPHVAWTRTAPGPSGSPIAMPFPLEDGKKVPDDLAALDVLFREFEEARLARENEIAEIELIKIELEENESARWEADVAEAGDERTNHLADNADSDYSSMAETESPAKETAVAVPNVSKKHRPRIDRNKNPFWDERSRRKKPDKTGSNMTSFSDEACNASRHDSLVTKSSLVLFQQPATTDAAGTNAESAFATFGAATVREIQSERQNPKNDSTTKRGSQSVSGTRLKRGFNPYALNGDEPAVERLHLYRRDRKRVFNLHWSGVDELPANDIQSWPNQCGLHDSHICLTATHSSDEVGDEICLDPPIADTALVLFKQSDEVEHDQSKGGRKRYHDNKAKVKQAPSFSTKDERRKSSSFSRGHPPLSRRIPMVTEFQESTSDGGQSSMQLVLSQLEHSPEETRSLPQDPGLNALNGNVSDGNDGLPFNPRRPRRRRAVRKPEISYERHYEGEKSFASAMTTGIAMLTAMGAMGYLYERSRRRKKYYDEWDD